MKHNAARQAAPAWRVC